MSNFILSHFNKFSEPKTTLFLSVPNDSGSRNPKPPAFLHRSTIGLRYFDLLSPLDWSQFPERPLNIYKSVPPTPYAPFTAALLIKLEEGLSSMFQLRQFLCEHSEISRLLSFNPCKNGHSLPTPRHMTRMLREIPNASLQTLLDSTVIQLQSELSSFNFGNVISLDTKLIIAWVRENNPKVYFKEKRFDETNQPRGDPDCRLGCKRRHNQRLSSTETLPTPGTNPLPASVVQIGEYYWGYASGIVATKIPDWGEFVLAELTQPFDKPDVSFFFPLMADTERRLGFRPKFGAFDAAFDASYVYDYFAQGDGYAAVPLSERGGFVKRSFDSQGLPLCEAGLPMPLKYVFTDHTHLFERKMGRHQCPLLHSDKPCPIQHKNWLKKKGCITTLAVGPGSRVRHTLDRNSDDYKEIYKQRTATERINAQAKALGIERPQLRNGKAIANLNTLIYILINLHGLQRIRKQKSN